MQPLRRAHLTRFGEMLAFSPHRHSRVQRYACGLILTALAVGLGVLSERLTGAVVFALPLIAVILATWYGGLGPGLVTALVSLLATVFLEARPLYSFGVRDTGDLMRVVLFVPVTLLIGIMYEATAHAQRDAEQMAADLQTANNVKDEFLGMLSHELKTPISVVCGNANILQRRWGQLDEEAIEASLADISYEGNRLQRMIDNLLVLSRLERGQRPEPEPIVARRFLSQIVEYHGDAHPGRQIRLEFEADVTPVLADPGCLEHVFANLLGNAEKYSPLEEPIDVGLSRSGEELIVTVRDRGPGVPEGDEERIFEAFYRSSRTRSVRGTGIGLAVCKRLIEAHGGRIWVRPRDGGGSEFGFSLPVLGEGPESAGDVSTPQETAAVGGAAHR